MEYTNKFIITEVTEFSAELADTLRYLVQQLDTHFQPLTDEDVLFMISSANTHLFVASLPDTKQIVGMVTLIVYRIPYKMKAQLEDIVVDASFRGQGIGTQLMEYAIDKAKELKVKSLNFTSQSTRESGNRLYQRLGFEKRDTNVYRINF